MIIRKQLVVMEDYKISDEIKQFLQDENIAVNRIISINEQVDFGTYIITIYMKEADDR